SLHRVCLAVEQPNMLWLIESNARQDPWDGFRHADFGSQCHAESTFQLVPVFCEACPLLLAEVLMRDKVPVKRLDHSEGVSRARSDGRTPFPLARDPLEQVAEPRSCRRAHVCGTLR